MNDITLTEDKFLQCILCYALLFRELCSNRVQQQHSLFYVCLMDMKAAVWLLYFAVKLNMPHHKKHITTGPFHVWDQLTEESK